MDSTEVLEDISLSCSQWEANWSYREIQSTVQIAHARGWAMEFVEAELEIPDSMLTIVVSA